MITPVVIKSHKRLFIIDEKSGEVLYTPPDFLRNRIHSRNQLIDLAETMRETQQVFLPIFNFERNLK